MVGSAGRRRARDRPARRTGTATGPAACRPDRGPVLSTCLVAIDAGGLFRALAETTDSIHLTTNRRQHDPAERAAVDAIRNGNLAAVPWFLADGRSHIAEDLDGAAVAAVEGWWRDREAGRSSLLLAATIEQVAALNQAARARLDADGLLYGPEVTFGATGYRVGDQVVCRRNDTELGVVNGTTGVVESLDTTAGLFITDSDATYRELAYVMLSHRDHAHLYTVAEPGSDAPDRKAIDLERALQRSQADQLALSFDVGHHGPGS